MELTGPQEIAVWHGLATNKTMSTTERLRCALKALGLYEKYVGTNPPVDWVPAALDTAQRTGELIRAEMKGYRKAIVDLRRVDRLNEQLWQANTAVREACYRVAADELERQLGVLETHLFKEDE